MGKALLLLSLILCSSYAGYARKAYPHSLLAVAATAVMRRGWFEVVGIQSGEHQLKYRLDALPEIVRERARNSSILDLGCAEGLLSTWLIDNCAAKSADGLEIHMPYIEMGRSLAGRRPVRFFQVDLNNLAFWSSLHPVLQPKYELVLALCVAQKMGEPDRFLEEASAFSSDMVVIEVPDRAISDPRSSYKTVDVTETMEKLGFQMVYREKGRTYRAVYRRMV